MTPLEQEDFSKGYAEAERLMKKANFNFVWSLGYVLGNPPYDRFDEGIRARLIEEHERRKKERKDND